MAQIFAKLMAAISSLALVSYQRETEIKGEKERVGNDELGHLQGNTSGCGEPPVNIITKVLFWTGQAKTELLF